MRPQLRSEDQDRANCCRSIASGTGGSGLAGQRGEAALNDPRARGFFGKLPARSFPQKCRVPWPDENRQGDTHVLVIDCSVPLYRLPGSP